MDKTRITETALWKVLTKKEPNDTLFTGAVKKLCEDGIALSKDIIRFFPTFTLHDETHIAGVCEWMARLMGNSLKKLRAEEAVMLLLAACWHDSGMCVSDVQKADYQAELASENRPDTWKQFFRRHPGYEVAYSKDSVLTDEMLRAYVRENHAQRVGEQIPKNWPADLTRHGMLRKHLVAVCQSHGESLEHSLGSAVNCDLNLCAVLLRLADALDYDAARTPDILYRQLGLDNPKTKEAEYSQSAWEETGAGCFGDIQDGVIPYTASLDNPQLDHDVRSYVDWVGRELAVCGEFLHRFNGQWKDLSLPHTIKKDIEAIGYEPGDFHLTMDQDKVIKLLAGDNLYSDPGVFVRELLQNAVDAVLMRRRTDPNFGEDEGQITIRTWADGDGYDWFRIEDNGIGMDEHILKNYFLKVGNSYYTSDEYQAELSHQKKDAHFKPISRFGIGILSCFMNAPDNRVEVLTRRYKENSPVYRLDMTGLHGYYFLTKTTKENPGRALSSPQKPSEERNDLRPVGTTVCVRTNLYGYGGSVSFKDLVDKYVCFPEVSITYNGPEGEEHYPTQKELMDCVHSLNDNDPNHGIKEYVHPIPDEDYQKLKDKLVNTVWHREECPAIVLKYIPLDWVSVSEDIQGVAIQVHIRSNMKSEIITDGPNDKDSYCMNIHGLAKRISTFPGILVEFIKIAGYCFRLDDDDINSNEKVLAVSYDWQALENRINSGEKALFQMLKGPHNTRSQTVNQTDRFTDTAFNGILADTDDLLGKGALLGESRECMNLTLLLRGENIPEVNLARDHISSLPPALACNLDLLRVELSGRSTLFPPLFESKHLALLTTRDYQNMLKKNPGWRERLKVYDHSDESSLPEVEKKLQVESYVAIDDLLSRPRDYLLLAALREQFSLQIAMSEVSVLKIIRKREEPDISGFPPTLFFQPKEANEPLGRILFSPHIEFNDKRYKLHNKICNYYNIQHSFSQWMIQNQKSLQEKALGFYTRMLETMILEENEDNIRERLNTILGQLRGFSGNPFHVPADLRLEEKDFTGDR